jgi:hypothetical protein
MPGYGVSVAIVVRARESRVQGEGPQLIGSLVATLLNVKAVNAVRCQQNAKGAVSPTGGGRVR